ncbi:unnamed protein product [Linum tenue]|uniref:C2H2-type domain-containing protein n=1 Tax=Linum tenue TaxID=586396 RepID=A0AAV0HD49_9ROSI|nr:unnamed protein product [Linum tenue]
MAVLTLYPESTTPKHKPKTPSSTPRRSHHHHNKTTATKTKPINKKLPKPTKHTNTKPPPSSSSSWDHFKNLLTCKQIEPSAVHDPAASKPNSNKLASSCGSICSFRDVVHGNTRVVHRADNSPDTSSLGNHHDRKPAAAGGGRPSPSSSSRSLIAPATTRSSCNNANTASSSRGMQFRKLSGCYECHTIVDPSRFPSPRTTICACSQCGEVFPKIESLELHQKVRHAVSELGPEDSGRNIVEIIFKSSWMKKESPICVIERILKVHNTQRTIQRFEDCRDAVKSRALTSTRKNPRCAADGNELLRFHCTTLTCSLGARGASNLCGAIPGCGVCTVVRHGFPGKELRGVRTTASSGRAHDSLVGCGSVGRRAMLVCRVIAGRVKRVAGDEAAAGQQDEDGVGGGGGAYDSVAGSAGVYSGLEELFVFNPKAILPCFVVIYKAVES